MPKEKSRKGNHLDGNARSCKHRSTLATSLEEDGQEEIRTGFEKVCSKCRPILSLYRHLLTHRGSHLKRKHARPNPKRHNSVHRSYRLRKWDWKLLTWTIDVRTSALRTLCYSLRPWKWSRSLKETTNPQHTNQNIARTKRSTTLSTPQYTSVTVELYHSNVKM